MNDAAPNPVGDLKAAEVEDIDLAGTTILVVDDNQQNLELMQAYLESLPSSIVTARDGVEAIEEMGRQPIDLVLLDVMMPRMSGFEVCHKIKSSPRTREVPVIMITALGEVGDIERAVEVGTNGFLTKPINKLELILKVRSLLQVRVLTEMAKGVSQGLGGSIGPDPLDRGQAGRKLERTDNEEEPLPPPGFAEGK